MFVQVGLCWLPVPVPNLWNRWSYFLQTDTNVLSATKTPTLVTFAAKAAVGTNADIFLSLRSRGK